MKFELEEKDLDVIAEKVVSCLTPLLSIGVKTEDDTIFTVESLSKYLSVSEQWVYERVQLKEIPFIKIGKFIRFKKGSIDKWLTGQETPAANPFSKRVSQLRQERSVNSSFNKN